MSDEKTQEEKSLVTREGIEQRVQAREILKDSPSMFLNAVKFEHSYRVATMFAGSTMVPERYRNNVGNCMIALNIADRFKADPLMIMQTVHVVHGTPGFEGKLVAALINTSGRYSDDIEYEVEDSGKKTDKTVSRPDRVRAYATSAKTGKRVDGPWISWEIAKAEGWVSKSGSKWQTIPEIMFKYRAASWFANINCPEVKLGMQTTEELKDTVDLQEGRNGTFSLPGDEDRPDIKPAAGSGTDIYESAPKTEPDSLEGKAKPEVPETKEKPETEKISLPPTDFIPEDCPDFEKQPPAEYCLNDCGMRIGCPSWEPYDVKKALESK